MRNQDFRLEMTSILNERQALHRHEAEWNWTTAHGSANLQQITGYGGNTGIDRYFADKRAGYAAKHKVLDIREQSAIKSWEKQNIADAKHAFHEEQRMIKREKSKGGHPEVHTTRPKPRRLPSGARVKHQPRRGGRR